MCALVSRDERTSCASVMVPNCYGLKVYMNEMYSSKGTTLTGYFEVCKQQSLWTN